MEGVAETQSEFELLANCRIHSEGTTSPTCEDGFETESVL